MSSPTGSSSKIKQEQDRAAPWQILKPHFCIEGSALGDHDNASPLHRPRSLPIQQRQPGLLYGDGERWPMDRTMQLRHDRRSARANLTSCCPVLTVCAAPPPPPPAQYNLSFYLQYLARWPEYCVMADGPGNQSMGYGETGGPPCLRASPYCATCARHRPPP